MNSIFQEISRSGLLFYYCSSGFSDEDLFFVKIYVHLNVTLYSTDFD